MVRTAFACLALAALLTVGAPGASGRPVGAVDLARLVEAASLVFVARVASVDLEGRDGDSGRYVARLEVLRTLKGEPGRDATEFRYALDDRGDGDQGLSSDTVRFVFFAPGLDGRLAFVDRDHPSLPALPALAAGPAATGTPLERAVAELAAFVLAPRKNDLYGDGRDAVEALASVDEAASIDALLACARAMTNPNRLDALGVLLRKNDLEALALAEPLLTGPIPADSELEYVASELTGIDDVRAIPTLSRLLGSPSAAVRGGAAYALRSTGSAAAGPSLARALYDSDGEVRYHGVMGLSGLANTEETDAMAPSVDLYERNEAKYLRFWRSRAKRYATPAPLTAAQCATPGRTAVARDRLETDVEGGIIGRAGTAPSVPVVPLAELVASPERHLGRAVVRNVHCSGQRSM